MAATAKLIGITVTGMEGFGMVGTGIQVIAILAQWSSWHRIDVAAAITQTGYGPPPGYGGHYAWAYGTPSLWRRGQRCRRDRNRGNSYWRGCIANVPLEAIFSSTAAECISGFPIDTSGLIELRCAGP
jgi:hypothetical protein